MSELEEELEAVADKEGVDIEVKGFAGKPSAGIVTEEQEESIPLVVEEEEEVVV